MFKFKKLLSIVLAISLMATMSLTVCAEDMTDFLEWYSQFKEEEQRRVDEITNSTDSSQWIGVHRENLPLESGIATCDNCANCVWFTVTVCAGEAKLDREYYHSFLLFFQSECYAYYYVSRGAEMCSTCMNVIEVYPEHDCFEVHMKCSKGTYDVCLMEVS